MSPTPRQQALALIAAYRAELFEDDSDAGLLGTVWTPAGQMWRATSCHVIRINFATDRPAAWRFLVAEMAQGVRPCDQPDCDTCAEGQLSATAVADRLPPVLDDPASPGRLDP